MMNGFISPQAILQAPLPVWAVHQYTVVSERLSPALRSRVRPHALAFASRMKLPGVWAIALQLLAMNEIKLEELAAQRVKALEVLETVMQTVRDVDKTILDNLT